MEQRMDSSRSRPVLSGRGQDLTGRQFGRLVALSPTGKRAADGCYYWLCRCSCGNLTTVSSNKLLQRKTASCGCYRKERWQSCRTYVGGTCVEIARSRKVPVNNTSGVKGVSLDRGLWMAKLTFARRQFFLGRYTSFDTAVAIRKTAEGLRDEVLEEIGLLRGRAVDVLAQRLSELLDHVRNQR